MSTEDSNSEDMKESVDVYGFVKKNIETITPNPKRDAKLKVMERIEKILDKLNKVEKRLNNAESRIDTLEKKTRPLKRNWLYLVIFGLASLFTLLLVARGWAEKPTVSITFNVGEIIGGLLLGVAAVFAALSYARNHTDN